MSNEINIQTHNVKQGKRIFAVRNVFNPQGLRAELRYTAVAWYDGRKFSRLATAQESADVVALWKVIGDAHYTWTLRVK